MKKLALISLAAGAALLPTAALADPPHSGPMKVERHHKGKVMVHPGPIGVRTHHSGPNVVVHHAPYPGHGAYPPPPLYEHGEWDGPYDEAYPHDGNYDYGDYAPPPSSYGHGGYGGYGYAHGGMITETTTTVTTCGCVEEVDYAPPRKHHAPKHHYAPRKRLPPPPPHPGERG